MVEVLFKIRMILGRVRRIGIGICFQFSAIDGVVWASGGITVRWAYSNALQGCMFLLSRSRVSNGIRDPQCYETGFSAERKLNGGKLTLLFYFNPVTGY